MAWELKRNHYLPLSWLRPTLPRLTASWVVHVVEKAEWKYFPLALIWKQPEEIIIILWQLSVTNIHSNTAHFLQHLLPMCWNKAQIHVMETSQTTPIHLFILQNTQIAYRYNFNKCSFSLNIGLFFYLLPKLNTSFIIRTRHFFFSVRAMTKDCMSL